VAGRHFIDVLASAIAAGKGDLSHVGMSDQRLANLIAAPRHDVDDARRESHVLE
jgi:hypothetical protein